MSLKRTQEKYATFYFTQKEAIRGSLFCSDWNIKWPICQPQNTPLLTIGLLAYYPCF